MPLYEYQCDTCGHRFEKIKKFSDPPEEACPKCGSAVRKLISAPAFQLKGTGWYITDYAKQGAAAGDGDKAPNLEKQDGTSGSGEAGEVGKTAGADQAEKTGGAASSAKAGKSDEGGKAGSGERSEKKASGSPESTKSKTSTAAPTGSKDAKS